MLRSSILNHWTSGACLALACLSLGLLASCASKQNPPETVPDDLRSTCCSQCLLASKKDPSGQDLALFRCVDYSNSLINGAAALDTKCTSWFASHPLMVQDCRP